MSSKAISSDRLAHWQWRGAPPDGGRDYGNANAYATPASLDTLVRETAQNSLDAARDGTGVVMRYTLLEISKSSSAYARFRAQAGLDDLWPHVEAASRIDQKFGVRLRQGMSTFEQADRLTLLRIDDFGTTGLFGAEHAGDETNPFAAFVRNNLDSSKSSGDSGGSFGLGKAASWTCSNLFTVLVATRPDRNRPEGVPDDALRFIAKSELAWHDIGGNAYAGPGWYADPGGGFASTWVSPDRLADLHLDRTDLPDEIDPEEATGTSLLIVGFQDPDQEGTPDGATVVDALERAFAHNFWPAILDRSLSVHVEHVVDGERKRSVEVDPDDHVPSFCDAHRAYLEGETVDEGAEAGDVARADVPIRLTKTKPGQREVPAIPAAVDGAAHLVVRLASDEGEPDDALRDHVALVRGRRMVVKYLQQTNVLTGGHRFHATLYAGTAALGAPHAEATEAFLRTAEPPAHDGWDFRDEMKAVYEKGTGARLKEFFQRVRETLRKLVHRRDGHDETGPIELRKLLQLPTEGSPGSGVTASLSSPKAYVDGDAWAVEANVRLKRSDGHKRLRPRLRLEVESGRMLHLDWSSLTWGDDVPQGTDDEGPWCIVDADVKTIHFEGRSGTHADGIPATVSRLHLDVDAEAVAHDG
ncbi:MAG: hypothetical protein RI554_07835 [Trueperaceae bacterium]|nr:hypothetical protein [Trueperaceae bacterium]